MKTSILICALLASACFGQLRADLNGDGYVDFEDFAIFAQEWNMYDLDANKVAHFKFDDNAASKVVVDEKGTNGTAQQNTSVLHTDGRIGGALTFNGSLDYIPVTSRSRVRLGTVLVLTYGVSLTMVSQRPARHLLQIIELLIIFFVLCY